MRTVCGGRPPDPFFPQTTGYYNGCDDGEEEEDYKGKTALMFAAEKGSLELCQFLVANKAEVNAKA